MKYRKKPGVIEAFQLPSDIEHAGVPWPETLKWFADAVNDGTIVLGGRTVIIKTLEGTHHAAPGDWIICGIAGEIYPCKPDIFELTYEEVAE